MSAPRRQRAPIVATLSAVFIFLGAAGDDARAATVVVSGPPACADAEAITEQVSELLGRPLASVRGVDFEVALSRAGTGKWRLRLDTLDAGPAKGAVAERARRSRELNAASCAELADAAVVGIAMSVRALADAAPVPARAPPMVVSPPASVVPGPVTKPVEPAVTVSFAGRVAVVGDAGSLPGPTLGVEVSGVLRLPRVRFGIGGTAMVPRTASTPGGAGGQVELIFGAVELCLPTAFRRAELFGCGGFELGRMSAEGVGVMRPRLGSALWEAARVDLGVGLPLTQRLALVIRAGPLFPLARPQFVINGATPVYRPGALAARVAAGVELEF